jgi:AraC-like DNA-binding protein
MVQNKREASFIQHVSKIVEDNMKNEGFGVSELAARMNMSRSNLHRKIKSASGISVSQFIRNARLDSAL